MTKKILWCSDDFKLPTGYSQVTRNILHGIYRGGFDVHNLSFQNMGFPSNFSISDRLFAPWNIYYQLHPNEAYGNQGSVEFFNNELKPDITAFLSDSFMIRWIGEKDRAAKMHGKKLFYFPFDSADVYEGSKEVMAVMDIKVAMSKFAKKLLKKETGIDSHYIPHGVDTAIYRPLPKEIITKTRAENKWENKFVVGCVGRNQSRKNLPALFKAFAEFSKDKDDAVLFMHCDPVDPQGTNLNDLSKKLGIKDKVTYGLRRFTLGVSEFRVNLAYNVMDIHVLPTTGEGFGLPIVESMAVGIPNVVTNCTTTPELLDKWGEKVPLAKGHPHINGQLNTDRALVDIDKMVASMNKLYDNPELRRKYSEGGMKHVIDNYSWDKIIRMWLGLLEFGDENIRD